MDAGEIQALRAMLAAQAAEAAAEKPRLGLLARLRGARPAEAPAFGLQPVASGANTAGEDDALVLSEPLEAPLPAALLLGELAPRRGAFGRRRETALELIDPAPREPARLTVTAPNGRPVGEIILHEPSAPPRRRPFEAPVLETPFFPEDLEDAPGRRPLHRLPPPAAAKPRARLRSAKATREVAATMLLAGLAARLAHEEASLSARLASVAERASAA